MNVIKFVIRIIIRGCIHKSILTEDYDVVSTGNEAELVIVNTCVFINSEV